MDMMRPFSVESLVSGFNEFSWKAWRGEFETTEANALSIATAPVLATYALGVGAESPGAPIANFGNIIDLHFHHLAIDSVPDALLDAHERALAKAAIGTSLAFVLSDLRAARVSGRVDPRKSGPGRSGRELAQGGAPG
ncbi:MAG TPA: hypothetical protein VN253_11235 [Kofleriaceae bacterium]|nr:hypothetical protein [Kofleriaceae bacterium]